MECLLEPFLAEEHYLLSPSSPVTTVRALLQLVEEEEEEGKDGKEKEEEHETSSLVHCLDREGELGKNFIS